MLVAYWIHLKWTLRPQCVLATRATAAAATVAQMLQVQRHLQQVINPVTRAQLLPPLLLLQKLEALVVVLC